MRLRPSLTAVAAALAAAALSVSAPGTSSGAVAAGPAVQVDVLSSSLALPWDVATMPSGDLLLTERGGATKIRTAAGALRTVTTSQPDLYLNGEIGLLGLALNANFASNRTYYTCQGYRSGGVTDIRVLRWILSADRTSAARSGSPVLQGIPASNFHGGCRLVVAADGSLFVSTGDAGIGTAPQSLASLAGKVLHVNTNGSIPTNNPFVAQGGNARYVWTYGHRNVQGLAFRPGTSQLWSAEHGPDRDDEVNFLLKGANYGWNPVPGYNQNVPMTDRAEFPMAQRAKWSSGVPTVATSGMTFISGSQWGTWNGALAVAKLKDTGVMVLRLKPGGNVISVEQVPELNDTYGRIRAVRPGPSGSLLVITSNGTGDQLLRVTPR